MSSEGKIILANAESDSNQGSGGQKMGHLKPPEQSIRCPRCESPNTKFCYYNNYSLSQPRYFCKTCRRYWTQGGALRNVPIGGGCRKNKKIRLNSALPYDPKCSPSLEFRQLGAIQDMGAISTTSSSTANVNGINPSCFDMYTSMGSNLGLNYFSNPFLMQGESGTTFSGGIQGLVSSVSLGFNTSLASSFESLSSINQELHWKLQQQRLGLVLGGEDQKEFSGLLQNEVQKPEPTSFQNLEMSKQEAADRVVTSLKRDGDVGGNITSDEWAAQNSFNPANTMRNNKQLQCNPWME